MARLGRLLGRLPHRGDASGSRAGDGAPPASHRSPQPAAATPTAAAPPGGPQTQLQRRRDELAAQVTELHWDLGGLAYEMALRDHFRLDVLLRRAAVLQERDAELAEVERLLRMQDGGAAGSCPRCGAPHSRGAVFCWQCGAGLMDRSTAPSPTRGGDGAATAPLDSLLASYAPASEQPTSEG